MSCIVEYLSMVARMDTIVAKTDDIMDYGY